MRARGHTPTHTKAPTLWRDRGLYYLGTEGETLLLFAKPSNMVFDFTSLPYIFLIRPVIPRCTVGTGIRSERRDTDELSLHSNMQVLAVLPKG